MALPHYEAIYSHFLAIVELMPRDQSFTSHQFILRLFQQHQREFIEALYQYRESGAPMRQVTSQISRQLHQYPEIVRHEGEIESPDIFGDSSRCATWRRV